MTDVLVSTLQIQNKKGLHARAASLFVKQAEKFQANIWVEKDGNRVAGNSIMGLMMLAAAKGTEIKITTTGPERQEAMENLSLLVNNKFNEAE